MTEIIAQQKLLRQRYMEALVEIGKLDIKKSGKNEFQNFQYFELADFQKPVLEIFTKHEICYEPPKMIIISGLEYFVARLTSFDGLESIEFSYRISESNSNKNQCQNFGATLTYYKRYILATIACIIDQDMLDGKDLSKQEKIDFATDFQVDKISQHGKLIKEKLTELGVKTKNDIKGLSRTQASELCADIEKALRENA